MIMRWSNLKNFAVPFRATDDNSIVTALNTFRSARPNDNAELHVFVPWGKRGDWLPIRHGHHMMAAGKRDKLIKPHSGHVLENGLWSEPIAEFSTEQITECLRWAGTTLRQWRTSDDSAENEEYALRGSLDVLRADLRANIERHIDDDLYVVPDNIADLKQAASQCGLLADFKAAYPEVA